METPTQSLLTCVVYLDQEDGRPPGNTPNRRNATVGNAATSFFTTNEHTATVAIVTLASVRSFNDVRA